MEARLRPRHDLSVAARPSARVLPSCRWGWRYAIPSCAIGVLSDSCWTPLACPRSAPIMMAAGLTLVIYGGYMLVTYLAAARGIVKSSLQQG